MKSDEKSLWFGGYLGRLCVAIGDSVLLASWNVRGDIEKEVVAKKGGDTSIPLTKLSGQRHFSWDGATNSKTHRET